MRPILTSCACAAPAIVSVAAAAAKNHQRLMGLLLDERLNRIPTFQTLSSERNVSLHSEQRENRNALVLRRSKFSSPERGRSVAVRTAGLVIQADPAPLLCLPAALSVRLAL